MKKIFQNKAADVANGSYGIGRAAAIVLITHLANMVMAIPMNRKKWRMP